MDRTLEEEQDFDYYASVEKDFELIFEKNKFWFSVGTALGIVGTYLLITSIK